MYVRRTAILSAELLLIAGGIVLIGYVAGKLWGILLPIILALLLATVLWPATRFLRSHRWPPALAASTVLVAFLALFVGVGALIGPPLARQMGDLAEQTSEGIQQIREWLTGPPLNISEERIGEVFDRASSTLSDNASDIAGYVLSGVMSVGAAIINTLLALVLTFFFLKDGPRWLPWLTAQTGTRAAPHVAELSRQTWRTLSGFIRQQALVGFVDAFFIGLGLWILDVPLVLPLAVLTFFGAFIPFVGAFVAGAIAVLIALVSNDFTTALIVLGVVVLVQQLEGNVLQPVIQGRGLRLHPAVVILAVAAGASLAGIAGAFLAVPVAAVAAVIYRYARDRLAESDSGEPSLEGAADSGPETSADSEPGEEPGGDG